MGPGLQYGEAAEEKKENEKENLCLMREGVSMSFTYFPWPGHTIFRWGPPLQ